MRGVSDDRCRAIWNTNREPGPESGPGFGYFQVNVIKSFHFCSQADLANQAMHLPRWVNMAFVPVYREFMSSFDALEELGVEVVRSERKRASAREEIE